MANRQKVSFAPSIRRLPSYLHIIQHAQSNGDQFISGTVIATELNLEPIQVRKDLAITGIIGKPKKGYPVNELVTAIEHFLAGTFNIRPSWSARETWDQPFPGIRNSGITASILLPPSIPIRQKST